MAEAVAVVGSGPAVESVRGMLTEADAAVETPSLAAFLDDPTRYELAVATGVAGSDGFDRVNRAAVDAALPWIAVSVGGVGGHGVEGVDAAVAAFTPGAGCHACLRTRVEADDLAEQSPDAYGPEVRFAGALAGREALRSLAGVDVGGNVVEVPHTERSFLPVPGCPVCDGDDRYVLSRGYEDVPLEAAIDRAERAVDPRVGLVSAVGERESFPAPYYLAMLRDTEGFSDASAASHAAGVDADWNPAYMKAIGEALERYSAGVYRTDDFRSDPGGERVDPDSFVRPDDRPVPEDLSWVPGVDLATDEAVSLPAEFVHFPPPEERSRPAITTGLGLAGDLTLALRAGLAEVVERDATMLAWYSTFDPLGLDVSDDQFDALARRARSEGLTVTPLLVTQDVDVPVVSVTVHREGEWPQFAAGSAAAVDPLDAARSALAEAVQNWMELRAMGPEAAADEAGAIARYADFPREVRGMVDPDATVPVTGVGPDDPPAGAAALDHLLDAVAEAGLSAYAARITPRDVAALGFEAVRVLVPEAQPLFVGDPFFGERAREVPRELGFRPRLDRPYHPYP